jgi:hypothetical protein
MWTHYCPCEKTEISVEDGEPCNWCNEKEASVDTLTLDLSARFNRMHDGSLAADGV